MPLDIDNRFAVVGVGGLFPGAKNVPQFWQNIVDKRVLIKKIPEDSVEREVFFRPAVRHRSEKGDCSYTDIYATIDDIEFDARRFRIPPRVAAQMEENQKAALLVAEEAMAQGGLESVSKDRVSVFMGNSMIGLHYHDHQVRFDCRKYEYYLTHHEIFTRGLSQAEQQKILSDIQNRIVSNQTSVTEDSAPGILPNLIAARINSVYDLHGPAHTIDAACASGLAAIVSGIEQLRMGEADAVVCGAADIVNKETGRLLFSGIGALSGEGSFPFDERADGFVIGDGAGIAIIKRLKDAITAGDEILAIISGYGKASDGRGKAIAAPNSIWQANVIEKAWKMAAASCDTIELIEAHGSSTLVGDESEVRALKQSFDALGATRRGYCGIGSVKSNIGHLKSAAGIAGFIKAVMAIRHGVLPPSAGFTKENPKFDLKNSPFYVITEARKWPAKAHPRRAGVSAFGFGGADYHIALEEYRQQDYAGVSKRGFTSLPSIRAESTVKDRASNSVRSEPTIRSYPEALLFSGPDARAVISAIEACAADLMHASTDISNRIVAQNLKASSKDPIRVGIRFNTVPSLRDQLEQIKRLLDQPDSMISLAASGVAVRKGDRIRNDQVALLFPGQGAQYADMLAPVFDHFASAHRLLQRADAVWQGLTGHTVSALLKSSGRGVKETDALLRNTENTHPAVVTASLAIFVLLQEMGVAPAALLGHSVGEFTALAASRRLPFTEALTLVHARGTSFSTVSEQERGAMAALPMDVEATRSLLERTDINLTIANINSDEQTIVSGALQEIDRLLEVSRNSGISALRLNVSHAFHSPLMTPAERRFQQTLERIAFDLGRIPVISNNTNAYYGDTSDAVRQALWHQITGPVQFSQSVNRLYQEGIRLFIEAGPGSVLSALTRSILKEKPVTILSSDRKRGDSLEAFIDLICALFAAGIDIDPTLAVRRLSSSLHATQQSADDQPKQPAISDGDNRNQEPAIVYSGVSAGLPGSYKATFRDDNFDLLFNGHNFIEPLSDREREKMVALSISKLAKSAEGVSFKTLTSLNEVIQLAGKMGKLDMGQDYHIEEKDIAEMSRSIAAAVAAGYEALRDAHIPLVHEYAKTAGERLLPDKWALPREMQPHTGVIFANGFPMVEPIIAEVSRHLSHQLGYQAREALFEMYDSLIEKMSDRDARRSLLDWYVTNREHLAPMPGEAEVYRFNHHFITQIAMQANNRLAQYINARGPNFQLNAACSSTCTAITLAESLIRTGKAERMLVIGGDDPTSEHALTYLGAGFLSTGACTNSGDLYEAALPFDKRRKGMIMGAGAVGIVIETDVACQRRGITPLCELLGSHCFNAAGHGSQLDVPRYADELEKFIARMEAKHALSRIRMAPELVYVSHETYTPPRGGCADSEATALKHVFGESYREIEVGNTKGMTGHTMGASVEDAAAAKALQFGKAPPVVNHEVVDPVLDGLNLSTGKAKPFRYALRMAAGFGSQGNYILLKRRAHGPERVADPSRFSNWLTQISNDPEPVLVQRGRLLAVEDRRPGAVVVDRPIIGEKYLCNHVGRPEFQKRPEPHLSPSQSPASNAAASAAPRIDHGAAIPADVKSIVLEVVAEITGYEADMLALDMDLEADLGVDTVKQATILATLAERLELTDLNDIKLSDYPTLGHITALCSKGNISAADNETTGPEPPEPPETAVKAPGATDASPPTSQEAEMWRIVRKIVAEVSGYAPDMLEADMELEADLGIDTVKQATILGILAERFSVSHDEPIKMSDFTTLRQLSQFFAAIEAIREVPSSAVEAVKRDEAAPIPGIEPIESEEAVVRTLYTLIGELTPYPDEMLQPDLTLESDMALDIETRERLEAAVRRCFSLPKEWGLPVNPSLGDLSDAIWGSIRERGETENRGQWVGRQVLALAPCPAKTDQPFDMSGKSIWLLGDDETSISKLNTELTRAGCRTTTLVLPQAEDVERMLSSLDSPVTSGGPDVIIDLTATPTTTEILKEAPKTVLLAIERAMDSRFALYRWLDMQRMHPERILAVTALDGSFAVGERSTAPLSALYGLHIGFYKALRKAWPNALVSILDLCPSSWKDSGSEAISVIQSELSTKNDGVEICYPGGARHCVVVADKSWSEVPRFGKLGENEVIVITGGGIGITAQIALALAKRQTAAFALIGRTQPNERAKQLIDAGDEEKALEKKAIRKRLLATGVRVTPLMVEKEYAVLERSAEIFNTVAALEQCGSQVKYFRADVRDSESLSSALEEIRRQFGPITTLIHGAGFEVSHLLGQKRPEEFRMVHEVKTIGAYHLNRLCQADPLRRIVNMSSISGRFGNSAQLDYAAANSFLDLMARTERRPGIRAISLVWSGWRDLGMAWRNSFVREHSEAEGLNFIPPDAGADVAAMEIAAPTGLREVIIHRGLGAMVDKTQTACDLAPYPLVDWIEKREGVVTATHRRISPERDAFVDQHRLAGIPLIPGVAFMEMMAETARLMGAPDEDALIYRHLAFLDAFKLHREAPRDVRLDVEMHSDANAYQMTVRAAFAPRGALAAEIRDYCNAELTASPFFDASHLIVSMDKEGESVSTWAEVLDAGRQSPRNVIFGPLYNEARRAKATRLSSQIRWNKTGIETVVPLPQEQLVHPGYPLKRWVLNPAFLDTLHQAGAVLCIQLTGNIYLPVGADEFIVLNSLNQDALYRITARLTHLDASSARYDMSMVREDGTLCAAVKGSQFRRIHN